MEVLSRYVPEGAEKTAKNLSEDNPYRGRDSSRVPPE